MTISETIKAAARAILPQAVFHARRARAVIAAEREYVGKTNSQIFSQIYDRGDWGGSGQDSFFSGTGSHDSVIITPYINAILKFFKTLPEPLDAVDLGCGDFNVGQHIRPYCRSYLGCDIVPKLIERNLQKFGGDFCCLDIADDELPLADVAFVRQVLQHLSNNQISHVVKKLRSFPFIVLTEHLPIVEFVANLDKPAGKGIRLGLTSGIDITLPPFSFAAKSSRVLCEVLESGGLIRTTLYESGS